MNINERAEKVVFDLGPSELSGKDYWTPFDHALCRSIASQIQEAVDEAVCQVRLQEIEICKKVREEGYRSGLRTGLERADAFDQELYEKGWNDGVEKATEIYMHSGTGEEVENRLRSLRKEIK